MDISILSVKELLSYAEPKTDLEIKLYEALKQTYECYICDSCGANIDE